MPEPIRQDIQAQYDAQPVEAAKRDMRELGQETEQAGAKAQTASEKERELADRIEQLRQRLVTLQTEQVDHQIALDRGTKETEEDARATERRRVQIERLSRVMAQHQDRQERINTQVQRGISAHREQAQAVEQNAESHSRFSRIMDGVVGAIRSVLAPVAGIAALTAAWQEWRRQIELTNERLRENAELVNQAAVANTNLAFLGTTPEQRQFAAETTAAAGRDPNEGARVYADVISRRSQATDAERRAIYEQIVESGITTDAPLQAIANALLTVQKFEADPQKAQNILFQTIKEAGVSDPSKISPLLARFLGIDLGGLSVGERAGFVAAATGLGLGPEESVTGLRNLLLGVSGAGTTQGNEIFERIGLTREQRNDFKGALAEISRAYKSGEIKPEEIEYIAGREGLAVTAALVDEDVLRTALAQVEAVDRAQSSPDDLTRQEIDLRFSQDPTLQSAFQQRVARYQGQVIRQGDVHAQRVAQGREIISRALAKAKNEGRITEGESVAALQEYDYLVARGDSPFQAARVVEVATKFGNTDLSPGIDVELSEPIAAEIGLDSARRSTGRLDTAPRLRHQRVAGPPLSESALEELVEEEAQRGASGTTVINNYGTWHAGRVDGLRDDSTDTEPR